MPETTLETVRPTLNYTEPMTDHDNQITFGYLGDEHEPMAALFRGESNEPILIPASVMLYALLDGWEDSPIAALVDAARAVLHSLEHSAGCDDFYGRGPCTCVHAALRSALARMDGGDNA
jgi:hypothetical protein